MSAAILSPLYIALTLLGATIIVIVALYWMAISADRVVKEARRPPGDQAGEPEDPPVRWSLLTLCRRAWAGFWAAQERRWKKQTKEDWEGNQI